MRLLVLGGTRFVGRHFAEAALAGGHEVTLFHRGTTGAELFPRAEHVPGDRDGGLGALAGRRWDAVVDCCGYLPRLVGDSARALRAAVPHYTFISSISAYAEPITPGADESHPLAAAPVPGTEVVDGASYGGLKAVCEAAVRGIYGDAALIVRPGLIVGPLDATDRFPYWPRRMAAGGEVLAPGDPAQPIQFIDARDLARWLLASVAGERTGVFNATGPAEKLTLGECLERVRRECGPAASLTWVDSGMLLAQGIGPWVEMPLWLPAAETGIAQMNAGRAIAAGLTFRPLEATARDTLAWDIARPAGRGCSPALDRARETALLAAWHARS